MSRSSGVKQQAEQYVIEAFWDQSVCHFLALQSRYRKLQRLIARLEQTSDLQVKHRPTKFTLRLNLIRVTFDFKMRGGVSAPDIKNTDYSHVRFP